MTFRMVPSVLLIVSALALAGFALAEDGNVPPVPSCSAVAGGPALMPAHPDLIKRVGRREVARMHQAEYTEQMRADLRMDRPADKGAAITGTGTPLIVLWDFSDHAADQVAHPTAAYDSMLFSTGVYPTGSMNDYYLEASFGQFGVGGQIIGWHTANNTYASYENPDGSQDANTARVMIQDMVAQLDAVVDFSQFDSDNDGMVDGLFFVHAGAGQEESGNENDIWSHAWGFGGGGLSTNDGVAIGRYSVEPEEFSSGEQMTVGVFTHEYGHMIGLPDLYDTDYSSAGIGQWGLMSGGSWTKRPGDLAGSCPAGMTAWCKIQMGWITPVEYTSDHLGFSMPPANTNAVAYRFFKQGDAGGDEYFLVENRRRLGFDEGLLSRQLTYGLPDPEGMIIYNVDESVSGNSNDGQRLVDVVDASPWFDVAGWHENLDAPTADYDKVSGYNRGDNGDLWPGFTAFTADSTDWVGPRDRATFSDASVPSAGDNECGPTGLTLSNIALVGDNVTFDLSFGAVGTELVGVASASTWDFEVDAADWKYCNSYAHLDQTQSAGCGGSQGLWFGTDGWDNCSGVGYGNNWSDYAWVTVGVNIADGPQVQISHKYELESGYDYGYIEVRPAGVGLTDWTQLATFNGNSGCVSDTYNIPAGVLSQSDPDGNGIGAVDVRLRMTSDGAWSSEDGSFCGIGWWVDEFAVTDMYLSAAELPGVALVASLSDPVPNPFNPTTTLAYTVPADAGHVSLVIYDQRGRQVRELAVEYTAGHHAAVWDGRADGGGRVASGLYFARLQVDGVTEIRKMALVK